jgi:hypothetical protein
MDEPYAGCHTRLMSSSRSEYNSDAQWLENEIAELNTFRDLACQRALQADSEERHRQLTEIAAKLRVRVERLANTLKMLKAAKLRP